MTRTYLILAAIAASIVWFWGTKFSSAATINEIRADQNGPGFDVYFELAGSPSEPLDGVSYIVIGDGSAAGTGGAVETIVSLADLTIPPDGYFLAVLRTFTLGGSADLAMFPGGSSQTLNFEGSDNVTHLLVRGLNPDIHVGDGFGNNSTDLDVNDDGVIDVTGDWNGDTVNDGAPWGAILDSVALSENVPSGDLVYSSTIVGPDRASAPGHVLRYPNGSGNWHIGAFSIGTDDTPGVANVPEPMTFASALVVLWGFTALRQRCC